ncbi:hypothetical protein C6560_00055 [Enterobacter sp. FS01]|nr:hypothetical protein C6560_00055 [Enterobacter sp. FS01]
MPGNNIFFSDHGVAFQTGFYKTRAVRFFMDSFGYILIFKVRLFNIKVFMQTQCLYVGCDS